MNNQISKNFTLEELIYSDTANKLGIDNKPSEEEYNRMCYLVNNLLQPLRDDLGKSIRINSCYRGEELNEAVNGSKTSQHCKGEAADIEIGGVSNYELACYIRDNYEFDQLILEYATNLDKDKNSGWVHVSLINGQNRKQCLTIKSTKEGYLQGLIK